MQALYEILWSRHGVRLRPVRDTALLVGVLISLVSAGAETLTIAFDDSALVNDTVFTINDIADISGGDVTDRDRVAATVAGTSAPPGYARFISTAEFVAGLLAAKFPDVRCILTGAKRPLVRTDYRLVRVADCEEDLHTYLAANIGWKTGEWQLQVGNLADSCKVLNSPVEVTFGGLDNRYPRGNDNLVMSLSQGARTWRITLRCHFSVTTAVLVTRKAISRGQPIAPESFEIRKMDITRFAPVPIISMEMLSGKRAVRSIDPGTILHDRLFTAIPVIEKGDNVSIVMISGRISILVSGIAREQGSIGDRIWVENRETRKLIHARIIEKGKVTPLQGGVSI